MPKKNESVVKEEKTKKVTKKTGKATTKTATNLSKTKTKSTNSKTQKELKKKIFKKLPAKKVTKSKKVQEFLQEYYDLPYRYNETIVTILAQTPKRLFVYWDISDKDKSSYIKAFGKDFFEKTYPVLLVHNEEMNYTYEVPINDFANSWYIDIPDSKKKYTVQLGRKFKNVDQAKQVDNNVLKEENINLQNDFIYITNSNELELPNDHILFESLSNKIKYRNVKTGEEYTEDLKDFVKGLKNVYSQDSVQELYTKLYSEEIAAERFGMSNPGSREFSLPTSSGAF